MQINNDGKIILDTLSVHDFFECLTTLYTNDHDVGIQTNLFYEDRDPDEEDYISVFASWYNKAPAMPFYDETVIATFTCSTIDQFMEAFGVNDAMGINSIAPDQMFDLYLQGKAEIECSVSHLYDYYSLYFILTPSSSRQGGGFDVTVKDDLDVEHSISELLDTPEQFIRYTRQYFKLDDLPVSEGQKLECGLYFYLENQDMTFKNKWDVKFEYNGKDPGERDNEYSLTISATWLSYSKNEDQTGLSVVYDGFDVGVLIDTFGITTENGLDDITPAQLQKLYYHGKACVFCWLDDEEYGLFFRLQGTGSMIASEIYIENGCHERICQVTGLLEMPEEFIDYTRGYYRFVKRLFK